MLSCPAPSRNDTPRPVPKLTPAAGAAVALLLAAPAAAGAWLEAAGEGFAAASATLRNSPSRNAPELSYYGAFGAAPRLTLGVDLNSSTGLWGHALIFARLPLHQGARHRLAAEIGAGGNHLHGRWQVMQRATLSYGQGFETAAGRSGWLAVDAAYELRSGGTEAIWKLDATLGLNAPGRPAPMLQLETSWPQGGAPGFVLTPSLRYPLPGRRELILGLAVDGGSREPALGLKLGLWQRF